VVPARLPDTSGEESVPLHILALLCVVAILAGGLARLGRTRPPTD
jgi:hypothetical protein